MSKVTILPYRSPYCVVCGRKLPKGRKRKCYACLPQRAKFRQTNQTVEPEPDAEYTINDRVAQAAAYGISYGKLMAIVSSGGKLPPKKRPIMWPAGSAHKGK